MQRRPHRLHPAVVHRFDDPPRRVGPHRKRRARKQPSLLHKRWRRGQNQPGATTKLRRALQHLASGQRRLVHVGDRQLVRHRIPEPPPRGLPQRLVRLMPRIERPRHQRRLGPARPAVAGRRDRPSPTAACRRVNDRQFVIFHATGSRREAARSDPANSRHGATPTASANNATIARSAAVSCTRRLRPSLNVRRPRRCGRFCSLSPWERVGACPGRDPGGRVFRATTPGLCKGLLFECGTETATPAPGFGRRQT